MAKVSKQSATDVLDMGVGKSWSEDLEGSYQASFIRLDASPDLAADRIQDRCRAIERQRARPDGPLRCLCSSRTETKPVVTSPTKSRGRPRY